MQASVTSYFLTEVGDAVSPSITNLCSIPGRPPAGLVAGRRLPPRPPKRPPPAPPGWPLSGQPPPRKLPRRPLIPRIKIKCNDYLIRPLLSTNENIAE